MARLTNGSAESNMFLMTLDSKFLLLAAEKYFKKVVFAGITSLKKGLMTWNMLLIYISHVKMLLSAQFLADFVLLIYTKILKI